MSAIRACLMTLSILVVGPSPVMAQDDPKAKAAPTKEDKPKENAAKKHRGKFTISKETTYVIGPLDKDGYIDYAAALNEILGKGVTPENNANVLLWKAIGPHPQGETMPTDFFKLMGTETPPEKGDYLIDLKSYLKEQFKIEREEAEELSEQLNHCAKRPWKAEDFPKIASWLKANETPLALVVQGTKRTKYFSPYVHAKTDKGSSWLINSFMPGVQKCRDLANALAARAMLNAGRNAADDAWQDLLACHRLGRLVGRGGTLMEGLVGVAIEGVASKADLTFLEFTKPTGKGIESCLHDLDELPSFPGVADKVDLAERFLYLDSIMNLDREGVRSIMAELKLDPNALPQNIPELIDWDLALKIGNKWYDRMGAAMRENDRSLKKKKLEQIDTDADAYLKAQKSKLATPQGQAEIASGGARAIGKAVGDVTIGLLIPSVHKVQKAWDRVQQVQDNLHLAFVLAWYQHDNGRYPEKLDQLAPKYLRAIPSDVFSGKALIYKPSEKAYLLYSVGPNGKDDGGRGYDDEPFGDDISVRMPLPERRRE
jgi:hypothetical protein